MIPTPLPPQDDDSSEISVLIRTLQAADERLVELTAGEVDTITDREGRSYVLRRAQNELRYIDAAKQAAILNALPAHIALLDPQGVIVAVNAAWRQFANSNLLTARDHGIGVNYLAICDAASGPEAAQAIQAAAGIRLVLAGGTRRFSMEYPCVTSAGMLWFLLTVTPLVDEQPQGVVVMHVDISAEKRGEQALLRFAMAMDATADAIYLVDRSTMRFVHFNDAACRMLDRTREQISATGPHQVLGVARHELEEIYDELIAGVVAKPLELLRHRADGSSFWMELRRQAHLLEERWTIVTLVRDVTERKESEIRIVQLSRVHAVLSGISTVIVRARDRDELFKEACRIAVDAGGFAMAWIGVVERATSRIVPVVSLGASEELLRFIEQRLSLTDAAASPGRAAHSFTRQAIQDKRPIVVEPERHSDVEFKRLHAEVGIRSFAIFPLLVADEAVGVFVLYARDAKFFHADELTLLTELADDVAYAVDHIDKQERLEYLAFYDPLTGLANQTLFLDRVTQYLRSAASSGHKLALLLVDVERFKNINDSLGRPAGDELLRQVAQWLIGNLGDPGLMARLSADHFAVVMPMVMQENDVARALDKALTGFLNHPFQLNAGSYRIAAKVGVALYPDDGSEADTLFRNAEAALKKAKVGGDRYLFYAQKMTETVAGRLSLENQLRVALEQEQFVLHYQPKVSCATGLLTGAEALIRWNDPRTSLVLPARFIPILEETGLIYDVGRWALRQAIQDYLVWRHAGLPAVRLAVNVSSLQLRNRDFVGEVGRLVGVDPLAAAGLELEITESQIMEDVKYSIASLREIRAMGVTIAVDDFGTGFSSLTYLAKLPIDTLKIDRSFVIDMTAGPEGYALVSMIINLAHSLNLNVVGEGIETEEQAVALRGLGCDDMQGYLFSKPIPGPAFAKRYLAQPGLT